ncbi:SusC/RagA family TonB-linked outer membrane protein [Reichenbachiella ulvae]|uniref:TonB-dependent receptor n=1 Tax=Reichenbachiella ulvae TaxID=2980104 RepID=A0ABT3CYQ6_9BACT|nr:TonB-dependent receptor [Reichenbachiella ulvae]MCV9388827.1 TonB-dependent receptor [Reichenbachiella ulvae]
MSKSLLLLTRIMALMFFIGCAWLNPVAYAQDKTVSGKVTDSTGEGLPGVTIIEQGTSNSTVTSIDGTFKVNYSGQGPLIFSFVGMKTQEINVGNRSSLDITMEDDVAQLQEVVVVDYGYGTVKKTDMTGAVASLSGEKLKSVPVASAAEALTGRLPGVRVSTGDGSPDSQITIRVRGGGSITQSNDPLFVVDGFIVGSINDIPPSDIESINVLKDASATAIYGAQAANGVVVITTKKAKAGRTTVNYNGFVQHKWLPQNRKHEVLDPYEYVMANYEYAKLRSPQDLENFEKFFGKYEDLELYQYKEETDWQDEIFSNDLLSQYHNLSITGGTEKIKTNLSLTHNDDKSLMEGSGYKRDVINFKLNYQMYDNLKFDAGARITYSTVDGAGTSGSAQLRIKDIVQSRPVNGIADDIDIDFTQTNSDNDYQNFITSFLNPNEVAAQDWRQRNRASYVLNAAVTWTVIDGLNYKSSVTGEREFEERLRYYGPLTSESFNNGGSRPLGYKDNRDTYTYRWLNTLSYKVKDLGKSNLDFLIGQEIYEAGGNRNYVRGEDYRMSITPEELFANMGVGRVDNFFTTEYTPTARFSLFGRANYMFNNKYIATVTVRSDQTSKFSKENRTGIFPAVALAWKLSEEGFMQGLGFIDDVKIRASYGETGNDRVDATAAQFLLSPSSVRGPGFNNFDNNYYTPSSSVLYNPNLVWETTVNRNAGIDFSMFTGKLAGSLDLYQNTARDLLLRSKIPENTGFQFQWDNIGSTTNKGVELGLTGYLVDKGDFNLSANFNIGYNKSNIDELDAADDRFYASEWASTDLKDYEDYYLRVGGQIGDIYGYVTDGYYTTDDFSSYDAGTDTYTLKDGVANSSGTVGNTNIRPGFLKLKDINNDSIIDSNDRKVIGNALPVFQGGFGLNAMFKGFDASVFFNYSYGNDIYNADKIQHSQFRRVRNGNILNTMNSDNRFTYVDVDGSYTGTPGEIVTDLTQLAEMNEGKEMWSHNSFGIAQATIHSWAVEDGSFIRLNNVTLGYSFPEQWISKLGMSKFRVYVTGYNLHVWTNYSGYDPEVSTSRSSSVAATTPGVDYSSFPRPRSFAAGLNITF